MQDFEEDVLKYFRLDNLEFDPVASYPLTDNDMITVVNVAYHVSTICILYCSLVQTWQIV